MELNKEQIIRGLECCASPEYKCEECPIDQKIKDDCKCGEFLAKNALELIKQITAENEKLQKCNERQRSTIKAYHSGKIRVDVIKEFAERLKEFYHFKYKGKMYVALTDAEIDQIVEEILEDK